MGEGRMIEKTKGITKSSLILSMWMCKYAERIVASALRTIEGEISPTFFWPKFLRCCAALRLIAHGTSPEIDKEDHVTGKSRLPRLPCAGLNVCKAFMLFNWNLIIKRYAH